MKDHQLRAFVKVAESGSIRAAARALQLSQSALTKALRELEVDVGAELLMRSYRGVAFTDCGQVLLKRVQFALSSLEKAREEIGYLTRATRPRLSIATTPLVAMQVLPKVLAEFDKLEPAAEIHLAEGLLTSVVPELLQGRIDFALALADEAELPREIGFEPLQAIEALPAGRLGNPFIKARSWADLKGSRWVLNLSTGSQGQMFLSWLEQRGVIVGGVTRCASPHLMAEMMRRTDSLGFCPRILLDDRYYGAGLRSLNVRPLPPAMTLGLLSRHGAPMSAPAQRLADLFRRYLKAVPPKEAASRAARGSASAPATART
jgi:LysR family transcriptional regulator of abg operon